MKCSCISRDQKDILGKLLEREMERIGSEIRESKEGIKTAVDGIIDLTDYPAAEERAAETGEPMYVQRFGVNAFEWFIDVSEAKVKVYRDILKEINETDVC
ncbi:hypothetical protein LCGC14_2128130 [marine sediment metagenome]|uniref:Uncharacterized protein n=1 Tax=marine sediment metagenome TaxID=412755 RepID=A0A0F9GYD4_9ZZZZ